MSEQPQTVHTNESSSQGEEPPKQEAGGQSAQADLNKLVGSAKEATHGFDFNKLFEGRIGHTYFLYFFISSFLIGFTLTMIPVIGWLISIALLVLGLGVGVRRFHDINVTGWAAVLLIIPPIGLFVALYLCWKHGDAGPNKYGEAPDPKRDFFKAILNT